MNKSMKNTDFYTDQWLKNQGLDPLSFTREEINLLRARAVTHELLTKRHALLNALQIQQLETFKQDLKNPHRKITDKAIFQILNLGKKVHRRIYRDQKKIQALRRT